jgi:hypothetical protein
MARKSSSSIGSGAGPCGLSCGCILLILLINITLGSFCLNYDLGTVMGVQLPWLLAGLIALVLGEFIIPATVIIFLVNLAPHIGHPWFK